MRLLAHEEMRLIHALRLGRALVQALQSTTISSDDFQGMNQIGEAVAAFQVAIGECAEFLQ